MTTEEFIQKAKAVHGDKYDYSKVEYVNSKTKLCIICPKHGEFRQGARQHLIGQGCPMCAGCNKWNYQTCYESAQKYKTRNEFQKKEVGAYTRALKNDWLKDYFWFDEPLTGKNKWTKDFCYEMAKKYLAIEDFKRNCNYAFTKSKRLGWLNDFTWLVSRENRTTIWTQERCYDEALKYKTKNEFKKGCPNAYRHSRVKGWLIDYVWFVNGHTLDGERRKKWTYETCYNEAKKYNSRHDFQCGKGSSGAYSVARKNGWLNDYIWFASVPKPSSYWTYERCRQEALKYKKNSDFNANSKRAYIIARENNWLKDFDWLIKTRKSWTYQECYDLAKTISARSDFRKLYGSAYRASVMHDWIKDYTWLTETESPRYRTQEKKSPRYWTQEKCFEEAKKYHTKKEFRQKCSSAYSIACKNGWISDYDWLMDKRYNLIQDKIDCVYSYYFKKTHTIYIGRTINKKSRDYQHIFTADRDAVARYAKMLGCSVPKMVVIEDHLTLKEGQEREDYWIKYYTDRGYNILNRGVTGIGRGSLGSLGFGKWTKEACFEEAKKYTSRSSFESANGSAYAAALKRGWLKDYVWFEELKTPTSYWTYERCFNEAKKYATKKLFYKTNERAYRVALRNGWIGDYTWFVEPKPKIKWTYEACFEKAKTCHSKVEFETKFAGAMNVARKNNWLKDYTWFKCPVATNSKWTFETCQIESRKYLSRGEFAKGNKAAYLRAWKNGWLDEFFPKAI